MCLDRSVDHGAPQRAARDHERELGRISRAVAGRKTCPGAHAMARENGGLSGMVSRLARCVVEREMIPDNACALGIFH